MRFGDFDVSEMSFSSFIISLSKGDDRWVGLPIFTTRLFFHTGMFVRRDSGIEAPANLKRKRVGVPEYQQTAALWSRGILQHEFDVSPPEMEFWMERVPDHSHGGATGFTPPPGVTIHQIPPEKTIGSMMLSGELDAALHYVLNNNLVDRSTVDLASHPDIKPLFPDPIAEGARYYAKTGIYPINHCMAMKRSIADKHTWAILNLLKAFDAANDIAEKNAWSMWITICAAGCCRRMPRPRSEPPSCAMASRPTARCSRQPRNIPTNRTSPTAACCSTRFSRPARWINKSLQPGKSPQSRSQKRQRL